jgi:hypothetical protein
MGRKRTALVTAAVGLAFGVVAPPAPADLGNGYVGWPDELPGLQVGPSGPPRPMPGCESLQLECVSRLVDRLDREWSGENAACDHRAVFTIAYRRISADIHRRLAHHKTFRYPRWFISVVQAFSNEYFATQRRYDAGKPIPGAWRIYYNEAAKGDANAGQDLLLASNAHTNHDLPYAYAAAGLLTPKGASRKHDHDAVNRVNASVFKGIAGYYAAHYDPFFNSINETYPLDQLGALQAVQSWRENAWREAERLVSARTPADRRQVEQEIEQTSVAWAKMIVSFEVPGYRETRDAYCHTHRASG